MGCAAEKAPRVCAAASPADGSRLTRPGLQLVPGESLSVVCSHAAQLRAHFPLAVTERAAAEFDANRCTQYVTDSAGKGCTGDVDISKLRTGSKCRFQVVSPGLDPSLPPIPLAVFYLFLQKQNLGAKLHIYL